MPDQAAVGLLATSGTVGSRVYQHALNAHGVRPLVPDEDDQVKAGRPVDLDALRGVARLVARGAQVIVLGCTELSVVAVDHDLLADPRYLDSTDQLARATIRSAGGTVRGEEPR